MALIDIGSPAIDRPGSGQFWTYIDKNNPANASGRITSIEIWAAVAMENCEVATFYVVSGNRLSTRDCHSIGSVVGGSKKTFEVSLEVEAGDYIGIYYTFGGVERSFEGGVGLWHTGTDQIPCINFEFTFTASEMISLYGTGITLVLPTVTTQAVTDITFNSATGNGNITNTGGVNCTKRGICWNITGNPTIADSKSEQTGSFGTGAFTRPITGLDPNVKYYVRAYAYNEVGYSYGSQVDFTTDKTTPTVTTQDATEVDQNQVKGNGNIIASGGENATERGFEYGLTKTATWTEKETGSYEVGAFDLVIDELNGNTEYWYRAYAKNSIGTSYGGWVQFQTLAPGIIPTGAFLNICSDYSGYTYQLHGAETDDGATYTGYFVLSTDLADKQGLPVKKRLLDLNLYFKKESSGSVNIYIKEDNEADWQDKGSVNLTGDEDIVVKHLPVDCLAKHYLIKISGANAFRFIGATLEHIPVGLR